MDAIVGGDINVQTKVLMLWHPEASCGRGLDFCCKWESDFLQSSHNPFNGDYGMNLLEYDGVHVAATTTAAPIVVTTRAPINRTGVDVVITFNGQGYNVCEGDRVLVEWNGYHNLQEVTEAAYYN